MTSSKLMCAIIVLIVETINSVNFLLSVFKCTMPVNAIICILLLALKINLIHGLCRSYDQKSTTAIEQEYLDDYDELTCCETVYPILYNYIKCTHGTLTTGQQLDVDGANNVKYIVFEHSEIPLVPVGVFDVFTNLSQLYLNDSAVKTIHPGAFTGLTSLQELYLQNNEIDRITRGTLNSLRNLIILNLSNNNLEIIEENALLGLFALRSVNLSHNKFKNVFPDIFDNVNNLENADLSHNHLLEISPKLILNLTKLHQLNLSYNNLTDFDFFFLPYSLKKLDLSSNQIDSLINWSELRNLQEISLSNNRITNIEAVHANIKYLNLSRNRIVEIDFSLLDKSEELIKLDLSYNFLANVSEDAFEGLVNLRTLELQNNQLEYLPVGCFRDLKLLNLLNLSSNQIVEFEFGTFAGLATLEVLDISKNKLNYLYESSFHNLKNLRYLNINENFITSLDPYDLLDHTKNLKYISVDNNLWNCKSLLKIVKTFSDMNVSVAQGSRLKAENVHGIVCLNSKSTSITSTTNTSNNNEILAKISEEFNKLEKILNDDFQNSSFYKYFTKLQNLTTEKNSNFVYLNNLFVKYFEESFENTTFYQYFNQNLSSTNFFKSFNQTFSELFQEVDLFNNNFKNSSLYRFSSDVFKSLEQLNSLKGYFNDDFENSTFYRFFKKHFQDNTSFSEDLLLRNLKFTARTDPNTLFDKEIKLFKMSDLQNRFNCNLMIAVVVILTIIMILLVFSLMKPCSRSSNLTNSYNERSRSQATDDVELM